jgi:MFS family permease
MPAIFFVQYLFMAIGVKIGDKFGARVSTIISVVIMLTSYSIILTQKNYYAVLGGMAIFGMGDGIGNLSVINNGFRYFPNKRGLVNGVILGGMGLASSVLTPLADFVIINPEKKNVEDNGFYPEDVANHLVTFIKLLIVIFVILGTLAVSLTFPYVKEEV